MHRDIFVQNSFVLYEVVRIYVRTGRKTKYQRTLLTYTNFRDRSLSGYRSVFIFIYYYFVSFQYQIGHNFAIDAHYAGCPAIFQKAFQDCFFFKKQF